MANSTDSGFLTNQEGNDLLSRFRDLLKFTKDFDVLVGYFFASGFYKIYKHLEDIKQVRILIGISGDKIVSSLAVAHQQGQLSLNIESIPKIVNKIQKRYMDDVYNASDSKEIEEGIYKFAQWLESGKLQLKIYRKAPIHAKLYIFHYDQTKTPDKGRVITGSSNLTQGGLLTNLEFNVELKDSRDYEFAKSQFEKLWSEATDISKDISETILKKTHLNNSITPYDLYLKFLYEYFKEDLQAPDLEEDNLPSGYLDLEYQKQAVINARKILEEYGGVFLSDVVGLGKTHIAARLANQLDGKILVLAPPALVSEDNPGSWNNVFRDYGVRSYRCESIGNGKLDKLLNQGVEEYKNIFIDEAHRFRNESTETYEKLAQICRGKRVILVSATPFNNTPKDLLAQIKLFQNGRKSNIPGIPNLESFFNQLEARLRGLDRKKDYDRYLHIVRENAKEIREKVLKYLMIRRTRSEIVKYFKDDLERQGLRFPEVDNPKPIYYQFNPEEENAFQQTLKFIQDFKYSRYTPMHYYTGDLSEATRQSEQNMATLMKIHLIKRFESSIFAFKQTLRRFIKSYILMLQSFKDGFVYVSYQNNSAKLFQLLEEGRDEDLVQLIESGKAKQYNAKDFDSKFEKDLEHDLNALKKLLQTWEAIDRDIKLEEFISQIKKSSILRSNKLIIFTESKETAQYLAKQLADRLNEKILTYTSSSKSSDREQVIVNFDANAKHPKDEYRILIATETLSEGVNLHRSNVIINYDIPWNPTRLMQRVGRINRVDTKFTKIHFYNFFPTTQSNNEIKLREIAESKIQMFIELLGNDAKLLTDGEEIKSQELFDKLLSKKTITGEEEEETELKYLKIIKDIRDNEPKLYERIKRLAKKSRTARKYSTLNSQALLTYIRKDKLDKFILSTSSETKELGFLDAIKYFEVSPKTRRQSLTPDFYTLLDKNKKFFDTITTIDETGLKQGTAASRILKRLRSNFIRYYQGFTNEEKDFIELVKRKIKNGSLPKPTLNKVWKHIKNEDDPVVIYRTLKAKIPPDLLQDTYTEKRLSLNDKAEVVLSELFIPA